MASYISAAAAIAAVNAMTALVNANGPGKLQIFGGAMPANADAALSGQPLLAEFPLAADAFQDASDTINGAVTQANPVTAQDAAATGNATWGRVVDGDDNTVFLGDVSTPAGNGAIKISSVALTLGVEVSVISLTYTQPK